VNTVPVDEFGQIKCPIGECNDPLYLDTTYCEPLFAEEAPGVGKPENAITARWQVTCSEGHVLWTSADQARVLGGDPTDPDEAYDHERLYKHIQQLHGTAFGTHAKQAMKLANARTGGGA